ncbi:hypothetical protein LWI29_023278 [Acer saccharum]|uniref:Uncharacterized protein n=1 Tax=Acer saccharum TaxID=4024 RepID=A0AA39T467_ACESA|nr:hypothetical protein LWI29_023278 [Acer saccharum]
MPNTIASAAASADIRPRKIIAGADCFGAELKDALISHFQSLNIEVEDLGTSDYYSVSAEVARHVSAVESDSGTRGLGALVFISSYMYFFTIEPYACEPSCLPKYPPNKEMDVKLRDEEARRFTFLSFFMFTMPWINIDR